MILIWSVSTFLETPCSNLISISQKFKWKNLIRFFLKILQCVVNSGEESLSTSPDPGQGKSRPSVSAEFAGSCVCSRTVSLLGTYWWSIASIAVISVYASIFPSVPSWAMFHPHLRSKLMQIQFQSSQICYEYHSARETLSCQSSKMKYFSTKTNIFFPYILNFIFFNCTIKQFFTGIGGE